MVAVGSKALYKVQSGVETTPGAPVTATIKWIGVLEPSPRKEVAALRRPSLISSFGAVRVKESWEGDYSGELTFEVPLLHLLSAGLRGGVTPTQPDATNHPSVRLWTFTPTATTSGGQQSLTLEFGDNVQVWRSTYCLVSEITISGRAGQALELSASLFGRKQQRLASGFTPGLPEPPANIATMANTRIYVDDATASYGTTEFAGTFVSVEVSLSTGLSPIFTAGRLDHAIHSEQPRELTVTLRGLHNQAWAAEWDKYDADEPRKVRIRIEGPPISGPHRRFIEIDVFGRWVEATPPPEDEDGATVMELVLKSEYDPVLGADFVIRVQNDIASLP
jgi:hypothetical protein